MSGPNTNFDPVQVAALEPEAVDASVEAALAAFAAASSLDELKAARSAHQGDKSPLALANREIGALPPSAKAEAGKRVGAARARVNQAAAARQTELEAERDARILVEEAIDVTLPMGRRPLGRRHPIELMAARITDIFIGMGWEIAEGPEIEAEWFNFDALNFDADHPARQMQDTFYVAAPSGTSQSRENGGGGDGAGSGLVLRTHTSPVQARALLERGVPLYIACPGRVFRTDDLDATHMPAFHQVEGLAIDKG
ncbi:MAG: phenylalanine--tRNA ligase subunit alpha, partial [Intrasporangiaceae bacterium]|nr:phenylalanine--tRNA ligase subunit alpha [Intrasporangiaceae bacterium]